VEVDVMASQQSQSKSASEVEQEQLAEQQAKTAEREQKAQQAQREANEAAYQASIEGQELPPSVQAEQKATTKSEPAASQSKSSY
jgi:hypothetical protein